MVSVTKFFSHFYCRHATHKQAVMTFPYNFQTYLFLLESLLIKRYWILIFTWSVSSSLKTELKVCRYIGNIDDITFLESLKQVFCVFLGTRYIIFLWFCVVLFQVYKFTVRRNGEEYSEPYQTSKMEVFVKKVNVWKPLTNFAISSILAVWQSFDYAFRNVCRRDLRLKVTYTANICFPGLLYFALWNLTPDVY